MHITDVCRILYSCHYLTIHNCVACFMLFLISFFASYISDKLTTWHSYGVSLAIWDHSVTFHPSQVNTPRLNPSQTGQYSIYLPRRDGRLNWPRWLVTYRDGLPTCRRSPIQVLTGPSVVDRSQSANHYTTQHRSRLWVSDNILQSLLCDLCWQVHWYKFLKPYRTWIRMWNSLEITFHWIL